VPISTVHQFAQVGLDTTTRSRPPGIGMLSTYPPTQCGLATFSAALIQHLHLTAGALGVVRVVDDPELRRGPDVVAHLVNGSPDSADSTVRRLSGVIGYSFRCRDSIGGCRGGLSCGLLRRPCSRS
jgi:hypothetical protein